MKFEIEWLDAPGVRDRVLEATWARLRIEAAGADVTELVHVASNTQRSAVYGPAFPLVAWLIDHWWALLHEPSPTSRPPSGRRGPAWTRPWLRRHSLLTAREGAALPDATFVRDGDDIVLRWFPDVPTPERRRVRFIGQGQARVPVAEFIAQASALIDATLARVAAVVGDDDDELQRASGAWEAIQTADDDERDLCRSLALLGLDPYDPDESTEALVGWMRELSATLPPTLRDDLLEGCVPGGLPAAARWLAEHRAALVGPGGPREVAALSVPWAPSAHQVGYRLARQVRAELLRVGPAEPIEDLEGQMVDRLRWDLTPLRPAAAVGRLDGLVGLSKDSGRPILVDPGSRQGPAKRFLLARSAFFAVTGTLDQGRLLTQAVTRPQRTARAFAAELLAPAAALAERAGGVVSADEVEELAQAFGVQPLLVQHQLENHGLGTVAR